MAKKQQNSNLMKDILIIVASIFISVLLIQTHALSNILLQTKEMEYFGSFVAGFFFTSVFTTAPAIVTLGQIGQANNIWMTALFGALGAVFGDLLLYRLVRDEITEHLLATMKHNTATKRLLAILRGRHYRWMALFVAGLIITSPLPDELALSLIGLSRTKARWLIPVSFTFNFIGILLIGLVSKALL